MTVSTQARTRERAASRRPFAAFAALGALLLVGLALIGYFTLAQFRTALDWAHDTLQVRGQIRVVRIALTEMETGQRGYLLTGEPRYLEPYHRASARIDLEVGRLAELTAHDAADQQALARLRDLIAAKRVELAQTIELRKSRGLQAALALVQSDTGKRLMDEMQSLLQDMEAQEDRRAGSRSEEARDGFIKTAMLAVLFFGLLAALLGAIYYLLRREISLHATHEQSLAAANEALEERIRERTQSLEESEARLNGVVDGAPDAIISMDETERIVLANPAAADMFGYRAEQMIGQPLTQLIPERYRSTHHQHVRRFGESGVATRRMSALRVVHARRSDGSEFPVDASISQVTAGGKKLYTVILRDITDEIRAKNALEQSRKELRELTAALEYVQEEERKRIAQELHDDLGQQLTVLKMDASLMRRKLGPEQAEVLRIAERLESVLTRTVQSVRRISHALRPPMLDDLGLVPALEELVQQISEHSGLDCELEAAEEIEVPEPLATPLYRVAQESLNNAVKHAEATRVTVKLFQEDTRYVLTVEDDGKGISADDRSKRKSHGLIGMRERVYALGGEFEVRSAPRSGTTIEVRVPEPE